MTALAWAAPFLALAGCAAYALSGRRAACLRRAIGIRALIGWTLACIAAVYAWRTVRHPARYARYLAARVIRRIPRRDPDGEPLDRDEMRAFIGSSSPGGSRTAKPAKDPDVTGPQTPAPAALPRPPSLPQPGRDQAPAEDAPSESSASPAGTSGDEDREAQREAWRRVQASYKRGGRGGQHRRRAARGTLPGPGMIRRPPPDDEA